MRTTKPPITPPMIAPGSVLFVALAELVLVALEAERKV